MSARSLTERRRVVKGIAHGMSGYTNYGCRCKVCTKANSDHSREYRNKRFAGRPLCVVPGCRRVQSRAYGNGLCYRDAQATLALWDILLDMSRARLKSYIRREDLDIKVLKSHDDDTIRRNIINCIIEQYPGSLREYLEEE